MDNLPKPAIKRKPEELVTYTLTRDQLLALGVSDFAINGLPEPEIKKVKLEQKEPKESGVTMDDLPELPFEKILGYLSLQERIKCRAVSRRWCKTIDSFRPKSLCFSNHPSGFIFEKARWISGSFVRNFVNSASFDSFFQTFGPSILSNLKHLRLCDIRLDTKHATTTAFFAQTLNSFGRLEELDIVRFNYLSSRSNRNLKLNLPMLNSVQLEEVMGIQHLNLDAPKLQNAKILNRGLFLNLDLVRVETVERLITDYNMNCSKMKNLKYLYADYRFEFNSTFLSGLKQLKKIHLFDRDHVEKLFEQKQRYGRVDLKIFFGGCFLSGPNDPAIDSLSIRGQILCYYSAKLPPLKLADQIPFQRYSFYETIEGIPRGSEIIFLNRFTDLNEIVVSHPVQDIERILDLLKNLDNIVGLELQGDHPQDLFNRLPDCCAVQRLTILSGSADFRFPCRLKHLIELEFRREIDVEFIREIFTELKFLLKFTFYYLNILTAIEVKHYPKRFKVTVNDKSTEVSDLDSAIRFIVKQTEN